MSALDLICIGAVNYDYMFHCTEEDLVQSPKEEGSEALSNAIADVENDILQLILKNREYSTQIGGSAFITLKVAKYSLPKLRGAYVGVCGTPNAFDHSHGKSNDLTAELAHLDDRQWLFTTERGFDEVDRRTIARSVVRLYNHTRNCIKIAPCANNTLLERIREQEAETGRSLASYLAGARWVHLSSLSDFEQFESIMGSVAEARKLNPSLKVSIDPGFEYTSLHRDRLRPLLMAADYIFLNTSEKRNLGLDPGRGKMRQLYRNLCEYISMGSPNPGQTLVVKHENHHELIWFENGKTKIRTIYHQKLYHYEMHNDTGAGDSFAGGFISGMLYDTQNNDFVIPIQMGVAAAKGRMVSFDYEDSYLSVQKYVSEYLRSL